MDKNQLTVSEIYINYKKLMYFEANKYLRDTAFIEEAMQEMLIKFIKNIEKICGMGEEERYRYIRKIAKFTSIDIFNKEVNTYGNLVKFEDEECINLTEDFKIEEAISQFKVGPYIDEYIEKLSETDREIITLVYGDGMEYREISEILMIEESAVRKRLSRAKIHLKEILEQCGRNKV